MKNSKIIDLSEWQTSSIRPLLEKFFSEFYQPIEKTLISESYLWTDFLHRTSQLILFIFTLRQNSNKASALLSICCTLFTCPVMESLLQFHNFILLNFPLLSSTPDSCSQRCAFPTGITAHLAYWCPEMVCFISAIKKGALLRIADRAFLCGSSQLEMRTAITELFH